VSSMEGTDYTMISPEEALAIILEHTPVLEPIRVPFMQALNHVLAEEIIALEDSPPFAASSVDGFAIVAQNSAPLRRIVGEQTAGFVADLRVEPDTAVRITTGAPLPPGADAVIKVEQTKEEDGKVRLLNTVRPGDNVRPPGQDIAKGQAVLAAGMILGAAEIGVLATTGRREITVYPWPILAVMSTGDEIVEPGELPAPGQIRDVNRYSLMAVARQLGCQVVDLGIARDRPGDLDLDGRFERGLQQANVILTSGGVSVGVRDLVKPLLEARGTVHFGRVRVKPGKPLTFATVEGRQVFSLPGNPVSALVTFEVFVRPALLKMAGYTHLDRPRRQVTLRHTVQHEADRTEFQRAIVAWRGGNYYAMTTGYQGSARMLSLVGANALLKLPSGKGDFAAGQEVEALIIGDIFEEVQDS
jgi:molybdenum cofactor synthesis domain-containing protein